MSGTSRTWATFAVCVAVALAALATVSGMVLALETQFIQTQRRALLEENVRLALWRMDSAIGPLIAQENARPYAAYEPFYLVDGAYTRLYTPIEAGRVLIPSPLLTFDSPLIRLHFQYDEKGQLTSPQAPQGNALDLAEARYLPHERVLAALSRLDDLDRKLDRQLLLAVLNQAKPPPPRPGAPLAQAPTTEPGRPPTEHDFKARAEFQQRAQYSKSHQRQQKMASPAPVRPPAREDNLQPIWLDEQNLILVRRVHVDGRELLQGCWLDWPTIQRQLLAEVRDLLPLARLVPAINPTDAWQPRLLASLPVQLAPGEPPPLKLGWFWTMIRLSVLMIWISVLVAITAVGVLLHGAVLLGERRGAFVSAVTHELRTPLTTFRMYTEMLAEGMVDASGRDHYLRTLHQEAIRLGHLVDNVLSYAKLERSPSRQTQRLPLESVLAGALPRLRQRAEQAGMSLDAQMDSAVASTVVWAEPAGVEQVLFNLVDNACKYAASASDRTITLRASLTRRWLQLRVEDHGPGVDAKVRRRLFQPFSKSAHQAADSAPGVGLGLALSRRYARAMGGRLRLETSEPGQVVFLFSLKRA